MQLGYRTPFAAGLWVLACVLAPSLAAAEDSDDPANGESRLLELSARTPRDAVVVAGRLRATDDFGVVRDRDFRIEASGRAGQPDRRVVLYRREPECPRLAEIARMTPDAFCDRLTLSYADARVVLAFRSFDANHRYAFTLVERAPGRWESAAQAGVPAPILTLAMGSAGADTSYRWALQTVRATYTQSGTLPNDTLQRAEITSLEGSLITLGDVLRSFNSHEFTFSDLPRGHPEHEPSPYGLWDEQPVEGGCIFIFCFGDLGDPWSVGSGDVPDDPCDGITEVGAPPEQCPWDLTFSIWPISQRIKFWKVNDDEVRYLYFLRNAGTGAFEVAQTFSGSQPSLVFVSLIRLGEGAPLVSPEGADDPYGGECREYHGIYTFNGVGSDPNAVVPSVVEFYLPPGAAVPAPRTRLRCSNASGRPDGRYRLYLAIDHTGTLDYPGNESNNIANSGIADFVHLR